MKHKLTWGETIAISSMLFGLFFGAGNLIFPALMGQMAGENVLPAALGFLITGVGMPLLCVIAIGGTGSDGVLSLSKNIGNKFAYVFTCALYLTIGPFFACPRCVTTPYEVGIVPLLPRGANQRVVLLIFSLVCYGLILWFSLRPGKILTWVGRILNPIFIAILGTLLVVALIHISGNIDQFQPDATYRSGAMVQGILDGYNTMDTLAGLAFGIIVVDVVKKQGIKETGDVAKSTVRAGLFSCLFMGLIYVLVAVAGADSRSYAEASATGGGVLASIADKYFGRAGAIVLALIVFFACIKTVIGLVTSCAKCFQDMFPKALSYNKWVVLFSTVTFAISNVGLAAIIKISLPVLMMLYPIAITLTLLMIFRKAYHNSHTVMVTTMTFTVISAVFDFIKALPAEWTSAMGLEGFINFLTEHLPFFDIGFGWVCPTVFGLVLGAIIALATSRKGANVAAA